MDTTLPLKIGRYEIKSELGRGGMAVVFRALDPKVKREVAVKVLPVQYLEDPEFRARFEREAQMVAGLEHPSIVPLYDFGEDAAARQLYYVMRLMPGGSLTERIKRGRFTLAEAARIIGRVAPGLDEAHSKGIVHRDLKPGNILFDQRGDPYIADFGIAKQLGTGATATGSVVGTPAYMSPEQARGESVVSGRSDVYSLGVILYEMLTGQAPFRADTPVAVALKHITEAPPNILDVRPDLPADCQILLARALAKDPDERYPTVSAFAEALSAIAHGEPLTIVNRPEEQMATLVASPEEAARPAKRRPAKAPARGRSGPSWGWILLGGAVLILGAAGALALAAIVGPGLFPNRPSATPDSSAGTLAAQIAAAHAGETQFAAAGTQAAATQAAQLGSTRSAQMTDVGRGNATLQANIDATSTAIAGVQATIQSASEATAAALAAVQATATAEAAAEAAATAGALATSQAQVNAVKVAFLKNGDIWIVNVDGSGLTQLTTDGGSKSNLRWLPDRLTVAYIGGRCVQTVQFVTKAAGRLGCFNSSQLVEGFEVSPDGKYFAVSVDRITYVGDYVPESLAPITNFTQLRPLSNCMIFSRSATQYLRWGADVTRLAVMVIGVSDAGLAADTVQLVKFECGNSNPISHDQFPGTRFNLPKFSQLRKFQNFGWDGRDLFALIDYVRNDGFGNLYVYNTSTKRAPVQQDPLNGCCYRDPMWSPDGQNFVFVWQNRALGDVSRIELYYAPYNALVSGGRLTPIPLPDGFFSSPTDKPQPVVSP